MIEIEQLKRLGLKTEEAKIYLACLELSETTLAPLARKAGVPRTTVYLIIEKLIKKGLISKTQKGKSSYYSVSSPEKLTEMAIEQKQEVEEKINIADKITKEIYKLLLDKKSPQIQYFYGRQGLRSIYEDLLSSREVKNYYIGSLKDQVEMVGERFLKDWIHRRVSAGIFSYAIRTQEKEIPQRVYQSSKKMLREVRFAPENFKAPLYIVIYGEKVAFITTKKEKVGFIVNSKDFSITLKSLFDVLWQISKPEK